ncbi:hypothetical protein PJE062_3271 [Pseudovibrio sp. JE062]|nr:hypothetical protein PJE062_3271 [Pseudovibrio sp. JE062]
MSLISKITLRVQPDCPGANADEGAELRLSSGCLTTGSERGRPS